MKLSSEQLGQMLQLLQKLSREPSLHVLTRRYIELTWTAEVMAELQIIFSHLHKFELLHLAMPLLASEACGKLCELQVSLFETQCTLLHTVHEIPLLTQVLDMLVSAGVPNTAPELSRLFDASSVAEVPMKQFSQAANFEAFHPDMLVKICNRGKWPSKDTFEKVDIQMISFSGLIELTETKAYTLVKRPFTGRG